MQCICVSVCVLCMFLCVLVRAVVCACVERRSHVSDAYQRRQLTRVWALPRVA